MSLKYENALIILWSFLLCWFVAVLVVLSPQEIWDSVLIFQWAGDLSVLFRYRSLMWKIPGRTHCKVLLNKLHVMKNEPKMRTGKGEFEWDHRDFTIRDIAPRRSWGGFCRQGSSWSVGMSLFALTCKSGAGHHQMCEKWAPACSCLLPPEPVNPGSPGRGTKLFRY